MSDRFARFGRALMWTGAAPGVGGGLPEEEEEGSEGP